MYAKQCHNYCSRPLPVYQDLSTCHDWPVKKSIVDLPIRMTGNTKRTFANLVSLLVSQNKDIGTALQTITNQG